MSYWKCKSCTYAWEKQLLLDVQASHLVPEQPLLEAEADQPGVFKDYIEGAWEQKAINGKGARPNISLAAVKQNNGARFQFLQKYADMFLVDKNPTGNAGAAPLADATKWEHRQVTTMHWLKIKAGEFRLGQLTDLRGSSRTVSTPRCM